jgi:ribosome-associated heat shock protein Hsp15
LAGPGARPDPNVQPKLRLDKWLFAARFFKARDLAAEVILSGHLRLNGQRCRKPGHTTMVGDVLTFTQGRRIRVVRVLALGEKRGPATEAQELYHDLAPDGLEPASPLD